jgi:hypothetical protein
VSCLLILHDALQTLHAVHWTTAEPCSHSQCQAGTAFQRQLRLPLWISACLAALACCCLCRSVPAWRRLPAKQALIHGGDSRPVQSAASAVAAHSRQPLTLSPPLPTPAASGDAEGHCFKKASIRKYSPSPCRHRGRHHGRSRHPHGGRSCSPPCSRSSSSSSSRDVQLSACRLDGGPVPTHVRH